MFPLLLLAGGLLLLLLLLVFFSVGRFPSGNGAKGVSLFCDEGCETLVAPFVGELPGAGRLYRFLSNNGASPAASVVDFSVVALYKSSFLNKSFESTFHFKFDVERVLMVLTYSNICRSFYNRPQTRSDR